MLMIMDDLINLINLKYFCDAASLGGVSASAKNNFVTQSAVSQGISKLEQSLNISLLAHHPNCFRLTPEGDKVVIEGREILKNVSSFKKGLLSGSESLGSLDFACTYSFAVAVIPDYLQLFKKKHPGVKINFHLARNDEIKLMVKRGEIDFGILPDEGDLEGFETRLISSGKLRCYISKKVPKEARKHLGYILSKPQSKEMLFFNRAYKKKFGKKPIEELEVGSWEIISNLVAQGIGIGYFPDYIAQKKNSLLIEHDIGLDLEEYQMKALYPLGMKLRKSSEIFLDMASIILK